MPTTTMDFSQRIVLITGASNGIGKQLAIDFAKQRAVVIGCGRSMERLKEVLKELRQWSPSSLMIGCDVGDREQVQAMIAKILADYGRIDILVNNAGIGMRQPFAETPVETIEAIIQTNYLGAVYCTHALLPSMIARGAGHIVNISSVAGKIGTLNMAAYCASKFAMNGWSESLYHELKPLGLKVSLVCPGPVRTGFSREFAERQPTSPQSLFVTPSAVSAAILRVIARGSAEHVMPRSLALLSWIKQAAPGLFRYFAQRRFRPHVIVPIRERA